MTIPYQHNCPHMPDGWCIPCVMALAENRDKLAAAAQRALDSMTIRWREYKAIYPGYDPANYDEDRKTVVGGLRDAIGGRDNTPTPAGDAVNIHRAADAAAVPDSAVRRDIFEIIDKWGVLFEGDPECAKGPRGLLRAHACVLDLIRVMTGDPPIRPLDTYPIPIRSADQLKCRLLRDDDGHWYMVNVARVQRFRDLRDPPDEEAIEREFGENRIGNPMELTFIPTGKGDES